jgi:dCTP diphosphatase
VSHGDFEDACCPIEDKVAIVNDMKNIDLMKLNNEISNIVSDRDWDQFHSVKNLVMALSVESAELLEIFQWMTEADSNKVILDPKLKSKVEDEVADVFVYLLRIIDKSNIDLEAVVLNKLKKNIEKYPVEKSRGNSKKYNDL